MLDSLEVRIVLLLFFRLHDDFVCSVVLFWFDFNDFRCYVTLSFSILRVVYLGLRFVIRK